MFSTLWSELRLLLLSQAMWSFDLMFMDGVFFSCYICCCFLLQVTILSRSTTLDNFRRGICSDTFPSCKNKPDGINEHPIRRPAPCISCLQERYIGGGTCKFDRFWGVNTFPYNNSCVQAYAIPKAEYSLGKLPSCNGTTGSYMYDNSPYDVYYRCDNGTATVVKCPENYNLNTVSDNCELNYPCNWYSSIKQCFPLSCHFNVTRISSHAVYIYIVTLMTTSLMTW